jgi:hypothetical protein
MDEHRFDALARALALPVSRRGLVALVAGAIAASRAGVAAEDGCLPDCRLRDCGSDGCGGSCGVCGGGAVCIDSIGLCVPDSGDCGVPGMPCGTGSPCCDPLNCVRGTCAGPGCSPAGEPCDDNQRCCSDLECIAGSCLAAPPICAPTGASCRKSACCSPEDQCVTASGGGAICQPGTGPCRSAGERTRHTGERCCRGLFRQQGRCVVPCGSRCDRRRWDRRGPCERGTRCRGGRRSRGGDPVCVPAR